MSGINAGLALSTDGTDVAWDGAALLLANHCSYSFSQTASRTRRFSWLMRWERGIIE